MVRVGIVGIGFMGWIHWLAYQRIPGVQVTAICSTDPRKRAGDWTGIQGNFGPAGEQVDLSRVATYADLSTMLAENELDLLDVCLPPSLHREAVLQGLRTGRNVFCEKPLALRTEDCEAMVAAATQARRRLFVGHVLPFFPEFAYVHRLAQSGTYGRLLGGSFKRVISDPLWLKDYYNPDIVGGPLIDLHVHDAHFIRLLFGNPQTVMARGRTQGAVVSYCHTLWQYSDPNMVVHSCSGVLRQPGRPFCHGFEVHFEQATVQFELAAFTDHSATIPLRVWDHQGRVEQPDLGSGDEITPFQHEIAEVLDCLRRDRDSEILGGELARDAIRIAQQQSDAVWQQHRHAPQDG